MERDITKVSISEKLVSVHHCILQMGAQNITAIL